MEVFIDAIIEMHCKNLKNVGFLPLFFNRADLQKPSIRNKICSMLLIEKKSLDSVLDFITQEVFKSKNLQITVNNIKGE